MTDPATAAPTGYAPDVQGPPPGIARLPSGLRHAGDALLRGFGIVTSQFRPPPDFLVIGTKRGGTTTLYRALMQHPDVRPLFPAILNIKSPHYFDLNYGRGRAWYRSHFPLAIPGRPRTWQSGESSPYYLFHPLAPTLAAREAPEARLIALLRDPVDRAVSHHWDRVKAGLEHLSLAEAVAAEDERLAGERERLVADPRATSEPYEHFSYVARGRYAEQLLRWTAAFPAGRLLVIRSEDLYRRPQPVFERVTEFLGLASFMPPAFERHHGHPDRPSLEEATRGMLAARFVDANAELAGLLDSPLWWDENGPTELEEPGVVRL